MSRKEKFDGVSRPTNKAFQENMDKIEPIKKNKDGIEIKCNTCSHHGESLFCKKNCINGLEGWEVAK